MKRTRIAAIVGAVVLTIALTGAALAAGRGSSTPTSSVQGGKGMAAMHDAPGMERMHAQMPASLQARCDAMHAQMDAMMAQEGSMMDGVGTSDATHGLQVGHVGMMG